MEFVGCKKWEEITPYESTQLLSLEQYCDHETKIHQAFKSMFLSKDEKNSTKVDSFFVTNFSRKMKTIIMF